MQPYPRSRIQFNMHPSMMGQEACEQIKPKYIDGSDGTPLACYEFLPAFEPDKVLVFYHDAGSFQSSDTIEFAKRLVEKHNIAVYLVEIRAHGLSSGTQDELHSPRILLDDIECVVSSIADFHPQAAIYVGAHGLTCSLISHYASRIFNERVHGYVMIAPYFGPFSKFFQFNPSNEPLYWPFKRVNFWNLLVHTLSQGKWAQGEEAWELQVCENAQLLERVTVYNTQWAYYFHSLDPGALLRKIPRPIYAISPSKETFSNPRTLRRIFRTSCQSPFSSFERVEDTDHRSVLLASARVIAHNIALQTVKQE